jgi:hypothetical protein
MIPLKIAGWWYALAVEIGVMELLTKGQLSDHIGVTPRTVESWMRDGLLPYIKIRRSVRFDLPDVMLLQRRLLIAVSLPGSIASQTAPSVCR